MSWQQVVLVLVAVFNTLVIVGNLWVIRTAKRIEEMAKRGDDWDGDDWGDE